GRIERLGALIRRFDFDGVDTHRLRGESDALEGVHQERLPESLPLETRINRKTADQNCRHPLRETPALRFGQSTQIDGARRKRVVAPDPSLIRANENVGLRGISLAVRPSELSQVVLELRMAATKRDALVRLLERLDAPLGRHL